MELSQLHFLHPFWLWAALAVPMVWIAAYLFYRFERPYGQLEKFIDSHLIPHLLLGKPAKKGAFFRPLLLWTAVWSLLVVALAGPRWTYREMDTYTKDQSLAILLDLSSSMNAADVKPSRLARAKQKVNDLLTSAKGVKVGLIAFAADPHMIAPMTDDKETVRHFLPALDTDLVYVQGSKLAPALEMASNMLNAEPGSNKAVLVISDGGYEDAPAIASAKRLADAGVAVHAMGIGTAEGAPVKDVQGNVVRKQGVPVLTKLEGERLAEISRAGNGRYVEADYSDQGEKLILSDLAKRAEAQAAAGKKDKIWDERFYWLILPALPIFLWWFRRGYLIAMIPLLFLPAFELKGDLSDYFKNANQRGKEALERGEYQEAGQAFQDPYYRGVASYKAGDFAQAETMFRQSHRPEVGLPAQYNLGNALARQQKFKEAIAAYEEVLKKAPGHTKAKENLELVKKMLEEQKQESDEQEKSDQDKERSDQDKRQSQGESKREPGQTKEADQEKEKQDKEGSSPDQPSQGQDQEQSRENQQKPGQDEEERQEQTSQPEESQAGEKEPRDSASQGEMQEAGGHEEGAPAAKTQEDHDADLLLNRIGGDSKKFMKNKFYIESKRNGVKEGVDPW